MSSRIYIRIMIQQAFRSFMHVLRAPSILTRYKLWPYAIAPIIITIVIAASILPVAYGLSDNLGSWIFSWYDWDFGKNTIDAIDDWIGGAIVGIAAIFIFKYLVLIAASPFMSLLSSKMEEQMYGVQEKEFSMNDFISDFIRGIRVSLRNLVRELCIVLPLWILSFIPGVNLITIPLSFMVQSYYAGFGNMDFTMERYYDVKNSVLFVRKNRGMAVGNGAAFMLLFMIPFVGTVLCMVFTATSAAHQTIRLLNEDKNYF